MSDFIFPLILLIVVIVLPFIGMWKIFEKAEEPGWAVIVPVMNLYKLCKISLGSGWFFPLLLVPGVNIIAIFVLCIKLAEAFGKGLLFGILFGVLAMFGLGFIFFIILGFGDSVYHRPEPI